MIINLNCNYDYMKYSGWYPWVTYKEMTATQVESVESCQHPGYQIPSALNHSWQMIVVFQAVLMTIYPNDVAPWSQ